jgi:hypothetical protein
MVPCLPLFTHTRYDGDGWGLPVSAAFPALHGIQRQADQHSTDGGIYGGTFGGGIAETSINTGD